MSKITWYDLPKSQGLFTRRSTLMVTLDTKKAIQSYSRNTKLNVSQYTVFNGSVYFRTESAKIKDLNWAIKADSFTLPDNYIASLERYASPQVGSAAPRKPTKNKKSSKKAETPKNEEKSQPKKTSIIKRLFGRVKRGN